MNKENKLVPGLPSGFEDRWDKKLLIKKKLLRAIEKNFIKGLTKLVFQPQTKGNFVSSIMCPNKFVKCPCLRTN